MGPPEPQAIRRAIVWGALVWAGSLAGGLWASEPYDPETRCLGGRFTITVGWTDPRSGDSGRGRALSITADTGAFWFFDPDNLELVVKTLDARTVNGRYWVFASGLTDLAVELEVEDTVTGLARVYRNPPFTAPGVQDTAAFDPRLLESDLSDRQVLWIGAHPDDEVLAAPWLGDLCIARGASCVFLVATRGEAGSCALAGGCTPDLAAVRSREMEAASALFGAKLIQWGLPDGPAPDLAGVRRAWAEDVGGDEVLVERLAEEIRGAAPDWVLTFDSRHGSTGHADHRALGELVEEALKRVRDGEAGTSQTSRPGLWRLASRVAFEGGLPAGFVATGPGGEDKPPARLLEVDAGPPRAGLDLWQVLLENARQHPSQFPTETLQALESVVEERRRVFLLDVPPD